MTRGKKNAVRRGGVLVSGNPPYGYRVERDAAGLCQLVVEPEQARIVRQIYQWYTVGDGLTGSLSLRAIARRLIADGVPSPCGDRAKRGIYAWNFSTIGHILASTTYVGTWCYGKKGRDNRSNPRKDWIAVTVPAIVARSTWEAAQERRQGNKDRAPQNTKGQYLLRRRVTCGCCGLKLEAFAWGKARRIPYYGCPVGSHHKPEFARTCNLRSFRADHVDFTVWSWLKDLLTDEARLTRKVEEGRAEQERQLRPWRDRLAIVDDLLADNRRQLGKLLDLYLARDFDKSLLVECKTSFEKTVAALEAERGNLAALLAEQEFSAEQVETVHELAAAVRADLVLADDPEAGFPIRARIVDLLDVTAILNVEDGVKVVHAACRIDSTRLHLRFPGFML